MIPRDRVTLRTWLAWYHLAAGSAGVMIVLLTAPRLVSEVDEGVRLGIQLLSLGMLVLFLLVGVAGVMLYERSRRALWLVVPLQCLQIPVVKFAGAQWIFFGGGYLVGLWQAGSGWSAAMGVKANIEFAWRSAEPVLIGINLVPVVILWLAVAKLPSIESPPTSLATAISPAQNEPPPLVY